MVWLPADSLAERFRQTTQTLTALFPKARRVGGTYQGFIKALVRYSPRLLALLESYYRPLVATLAGEKWRRHGWIPLGVDGSRVALPHSAANRKAFGCGGKVKSAPSAWLVMLLHLGLDLPWAWKIAKATADERGLLRQMAGLLPAGTLLIADAGYTGYDFWQSLHQAGHGFLIRVGANTRLLTQLAFVREYPGLVYVWPKRQQHAGLAPLILRLIVLNDGRQQVYLVTNVLETSRLSDAEAAAFYRLRWHLEIFFRNLKSTVGKRHLRSKAPVPAALELRWAVLGLALLGYWCLQQQLPAGLDPHRVSLAQALRHLRAVLQNPQRRCRRGQSLAARLLTAVGDRYVRRGPKHSGHWPHKKNDGPPKPPKLVAATPNQIHAAQLLAAHLRVA